MNSRWSLRLQAALTQRKQQHRFRTRKIIDSPQGVQLTLDGRAVRAFCSNDYLGFAHHPEIVEALRVAALRWGVGSGASHLVSGHFTPHHLLEEELAAFTGRDRALVFSSGYLANLGVISALGGKDAVNKKDTVIIGDRLNHASLLDAAQLAGSELLRYQHNDIESCARQFERVGDRYALLVTDGVFSMDGDIAPLPALATLATQHGALLMVDDAHGFGVLGAHGGGCAEQFALDQQALPLLVGTLGKAFGTSGAFVAGSHDIIEAILQQARPYIYTTGMSPALAEATRTSLRLLRAADDRRAQLRNLVTYFRNRAVQLNLSLQDSTTPIQPLLIGDDARAVQVGEQLLARGFLVGVIRPPTVPEGTARLRISLCAEHSTQDVDDLLHAIAEVLHS